VDEEVFDRSDPDLEAPFDPALGSMEQHIAAALRKSRHRVSVVAFTADHRELVSRVAAAKPQVVFNLVEHIGGDRRLSPHIPAMLEILRVPYTGCSAHGMALALDKASSKRLVRDVGFNIPNFIVVPDHAVLPPGKLRFPVLVKPRFGGGSEGITLSSLVQTQDQLHRRARYLHRTVRQPAICEEFVKGRELSVAVVGNGPNVQALPVRETFFPSASSSSLAPTFCTDRIKSSASYRKRWQISYGRAQLSADTEARILDLCRRAFLQLRLTGYARIDLRFTEDGKLFFLEANPNPDLNPRVFGLMAEWAGFSYEVLLSRILDLALRRQYASPITL